ncbi:hypothetical protein A2348_03390 [Candidatus Uhrbacteria bacterium RIFOXYB12_FULL_58_10]|uniref:Uncharacterized protein n=1 Tax=Candidatus Uhrbacteria bacterium RIFOXYB2_FULL_57_15 TaxID=1802422 RepID=A0A1F7W5T4_9BACT|nr:MAG: hypothetical protein A2348_03390 [Candidatus Uhrbacteria bacterium RIFOXYB12_FULL_58_10]OGL98110.1 MAG: hypothetical protein A2304_03440 [Candidatus Uhrbacteria bacterium RIFOXYB2_FULL_57_15]
MTVPLTLESARSTGILDLLCSKTRDVRWSNVDGLDGRARRGFMGLDLEFTWQVVQQKAVDLLRTKDYGKKTHLEVCMAVRDMSLSFETKFARDLCDEIEKRTGKRPPESPVLPLGDTEPRPRNEPIPENVPTPPTTAQTNIRDLLTAIGEAINLLQRLMARLQDEMAFLSRARASMLDGFDVVPNQDAPDSIRTFYGLHDGHPTSDQILGRLRTIEAELRACERMFHDTHTNPSGKRRLNDAFAILLRYVP